MKKTGKRLVSFLTLALMSVLVTISMTTPAFAESGSSDGSGLDDRGKTLILVMMALLVVAVLLVGLYRTAKKAKGHMTAYIPSGRKQKRAEEDKIDNAPELIVAEEPVIEAEEFLEGDEDMFSTMAKNKSKTFEDRLFEADDATRANYAEIKAELLAIKKVKQRISRKCDSYRIGRNLLAKIIIRGKSVRCFFALDPKAYEETVYHHKDAGEKKAYEEVPMAVRIRSPRSLKKAKRLVAELAKKFEA